MGRLEETRWQSKGCTLVPGGPSGACCVMSSQPGTMWSARVCPQWDDEGLRSRWESQGPCFLVDRRISPKDAGEVRAQLWNSHLPALWGSDQLQHRAKPEAKPAKAVVNSPLFKGWYHFHVCKLMPLLSAILRLFLRGGSKKTKWNSQTIATISSYYCMRLALPPTYSVGYYCLLFLYFAYSKFFRIIHKILV